MSLIGRFEHLPKRPRSDEARPLLEKIASQVKPIMAKRGWKVGTLAEFLPSNPALLGNNMNHGQRINLRLRPPGAEGTFYEYDQLVLVMLHELTHIEHGPHNAQFYKLLAELEEEFYELKRKGYSGEGFHSSGHYLAGTKVPEYMGKAKGLAAAEKRLATSKVIGRGGVLGGRARAGDGRSMQEIVAEAAERRLRDDKTCKTGAEGKEVEEEVRKAQAESEGVDAVDIPAEEMVSIEVAVSNRAVVVDSDSSNSDIEIIGPPAPLKKLVDRPVAIQAAGEGSAVRNRQAPGGKATPRTDGRSNKHNPVPNKGMAARGTSSSISQKIPMPPPPPNTSSEWACPTCTLINPSTARTCEACDSPNPTAPTVNVSGNSGMNVNGSSTEGWWCEFCGAGPREMAYWSCAECGWVRKWG